VEKKITDINTKMELILTFGQLLIENGSSNDKVIRVINRIARFMKIPKENFELQIMKQIIFLEVFDGEKYLFAFRKCRKTVVDFYIIYSLTKISWQLLKESVTLEELKSILEYISAKPKIYSQWKIILAVGCACGAFCCLFGGDIYEMIGTAFCAMSGKFIQIKLLKHKVNEYFSIMFAAFVATTGAYFCPPITSLKPMIACSLFLMPGVPIINAVVDTTNKFFLKALVEFFRTFCIVSSITIGIVFSIEVCSRLRSLEFADFLLMSTVPDVNIFALSLAGAICAIGFAIPMNMPKKFLFIVGILGASTIFLRNVFYFNVGLNQEASTFITAFFIGHLSIIISQRLNLVSSILMVPPLITMVPGVIMYRVLFAFIKIEEMDVEELTFIFGKGIDILEIFSSIVVGANLLRLIGQKKFDQ
jgi:uncharacterized membrane protein YjjP (DUF1212 family)